MKTGVKGLDDVFQYGNEITMIYGSAATGKTTLAKLAAAEQAKEGKKVIYIDSEHGFSIDRFRQLSGQDYVKHLDNLIFFRPENLKGQRKTIKELVPIVEAGKISLVILDTIGVHYRAELRLDEKYANKSIDEALKIFKWINSKGIPVILINQVYSDLNNNIKNVGGNMIFKSCDCVIRLEKEPRKIVMEKPAGKETRFEILENGIRILEKI